ncbi:MAG: 3'-5' exonuclease, partial [Bellilinea sp.]
MMNTVRDEMKSYICVDVETAGPVPSRYALLSIGACTLGQPRESFYVELQPDKDLTDPEAMAVHNLDMVKLQQE